MFSHFGVDSSNLNKSAQKGSQEKKFCDKVALNVTILQWN